MNDKLIIAHRGASEYYPENTLESFKKAIDLGADMIELDIRQTGDRLFIVFHDDCISGKAIKDLSFKTVFRMGLKMGIEIPTFEEALQLTRGKIKLDIELKEKGQEKEIVELVSKYFNTKDFIISSFNHCSLKTIKNIDPHIEVGLILGNKQPKSFFFSILLEPFSIKKSIKINSDFLILHWKLLRFGIAFPLLRGHQKKVVVWTVNSKKKLLKYLRDKRIHGIITDKPDLALSLAQEPE